MPDVRTPGKRGRLPARRGEAQSPLRFVHEYAALPAPVYPVDVSAGITDWGMLGNGPDPACTTHPDGVGNCTFAGRQHLKMAKAAAGGIYEKWETSNQLVAEYLRYDHGRDEGAVIADLLLDWYDAGLILAFAPVDHTDPAKVDAATQAFHGAYCGVDLTDDADERFGQALPWTVEDGQQPDPDEGHCVVKVKARVTVDGQLLDEWATWGAGQYSTLEWSAACVTECWVIITQEDADAASLDIAALRADIDALHGTGGDPAPVAPPAPTLLSRERAELEAIFDRIRALPERELGTIVRFLRSHGF